MADFSGRYYLTSRDGWLCIVHEVKFPGNFMKIEFQSYLQIFLFLKYRYQDPISGPLDLNVWKWSPGMCMFACLYIHAMTLVCDLG